MLNDIFIKNYINHQLVLKLLNYNNRLILFNLSKIYIINYI